MEITLCVGSSCHLKGAPAILSRLNDLIAQNQLEGRLRLSGSFCMDQCTKGSSGVCVQVDGTVYSVTAATIDHFFQTEILNKLNSR